ncbi:MAG: M15 family metallopeptidase [Candidatus Omnitrophica bacterium]|nr:M15 family metallopeptidase [Candidatus Omnitrophota bacterium]
MKRIIPIIICIAIILGSAKKELITKHDVPSEIKEKIIGNSWKEKGPVDIRDLAYLKVKYLGFDQKKHMGDIIVNKDIAKEIEEIFNELYQNSFPIEKIRLIDEYNADDNLSMEDNNSSALCVRNIAGKDEWSMHSYGLAIDINPVQNPFISETTVSPEKGKEYLDRKNVRQGMIVKGDPCYNTFIKRGWVWGGDWETPKDYMHFEKRDR